MQPGLFWCVCIVLLIQTDIVFSGDTSGLRTDFRFQNDYQINSGYINYASLDNLYSDNVYSGGNIFYELAVGIRAKIFVQTSAKFAIFDRKPKSLAIDPEIIPPENRLSRINHLHFELDNSYRFQVFRDKFFNVNFYISGNWFTSGDYIINDYMDPELLLSSISPGSYVEYNSKVFLIYVQLFSPLISYTCRNNYSFSRASDYEEFGPSDFMKENSHIQFPNTLSGFFVNSGCKLNVSKHIGMQLEYHFRYLKDSDPRILKAITSIYSIGLFYRVTR